MNEPRWRTGRAIAFGATCCLVGAILDAGLRAEFGSASDPPGASVVDPGDPSLETSLRADQQRRISDVFFLGDSIIAGMDLDRYLAQYSAANRGVGQNRVGNMLERLKGTVLDGGPRCVVIMGGINDLSFGAPVDWISATFEQMISEIETTGAAVVLITTPQPSGGALAPFVADANRQVMNAWLRDRSGANPTRVRLADFGHTADELGAQGFSTMTSDGYHLNDSGYRALAELLRPEIDACLAAGG